MENLDNDRSIKLKKDELDFVQKRPGIAPRYDTFVFSNPNFFKNLISSLFMQCPFLILSLKNVIKHKYPFFFSTLENSLNCEYRKDSERIMVLNSTAIKTLIDLSGIARFNPFVWNVASPFFFAELHKESE